VSNQKIFCAIFVDVTDGMDFAKLLAREILDAFAQMYSSELDGKVSSPDLFTGFNGKIAEVISNSVRPVLDALQDQRGIKMALLVSGESLKHATSEVDKLSVLANHSALLNVAAEIMNVENDLPLSLSLKTKATTLFLQRIERSSLVVIYKNNIDEQMCLQAIEKSARLLKSVLILNNNLQDVKTF